MKYVIALFILFELLSFREGFPQTAPDTSAADSIKPVAAGASALRSLILPGWGQIRQEKLWKAAVLYAGSATFYYRSAYHLNRYYITDNVFYRDKAVMDVSIAVFTHTLAILDAWSTAKTQAPVGWQAQLLSDRPLKSPWGATLRSAIIPGWGQLYTESYLKAVGWAGLVSWLTYETWRNDRQFDRTGIGEYRDDFRRFAWYLGLAYLLMLTDAHVDAYLYKFDKAIELAVTPAVIQERVGLNLSIQW